MRVRIDIAPKTAVMAGRLSAGKEIVSIDPAELTTDGKVELCRWEKSSDDRSDCYEFHIRSGLRSPSSPGQCDLIKSFAPPMTESMEVALKALIETLAVQRKADAAAAEAEQAEKDAETARKAAQKQKDREEAIYTLQLMTAEDRFLDCTCLYGDGTRTLNLNHKYNVLFPGFPRTTVSGDEFIQRVADDLASRLKAFNAVVEQENKRPTLEWIEANGSDLLKAMAKEGLPIDRIYVAERMEKDRPDWVQVPENRFSNVDSVTPSLADFALLEEARKVDPDAYLAEYRTDDDEYVIAVRGEFLGRDLVFKPSFDADSW